MKHPDVWLDHYGALWGWPVVGICLGQYNTKNDSKIVSIHSVQICRVQVDFQQIGLDNTFFKANLYYTRFSILSI
ncbi:MAG TPA: hypothetical protein DHW36_05700 [Thalassospira sp.]|nr:hypothetical protein [Thalassospira sp.]|tara:strand:- start:188 stop:412 length:225 start_codon:yes stop_codon:yes gene_type:complete